ncbi:MAG: metal-dependent hydrolase [Bacteroidia bacterium]
MPTIFTHGFAAFTLGKTFFEKVSTTKLLIAAVICAMLPDADVIGFAFHIPYESMFGHRGFTHSICFAILLALIVKEIFFREVKLNSKTGRLIFLLLFLSTVSHPLLDMLTNGGRGVALFAPFSNHRYFCPWFRPIQVSPIGAGNFFSKWGVEVLISEFKWIVLPCIVILLGAKFFKKAK